MKRLLFALLAVALLPLSAAAQTTGVPKPKLSTANFGSTTSAELRAVLSDETGTGAFYTQGGDLGTPSAGVLTNVTGLPVSTGIAGLGTGVAAALAVNVGSAGAPVVIGGALGTPSSGTLTNASGLPIASGVSGLGSGVATALAVSAGSAGGIATVGGSIGAATGTSLALGDGLVGTPAFTFSSDITSGMWRPTSGAVAIAVGGANQLRLTSAVNRVPSTTALAWGSTTADSPSDTGLSRLGAGIVGIGTGAAGNAGGEIRAGVATFTGAISGPTLALGGATIGAHALNATGTIRASGDITSDGNFRTGNYFRAANFNTFLYLDKAAATFQLGQTDVASPVAQTLSVQNVIVGTSNAAGAALTIASSRGTGTGNGGDLILQVAPAGSSGSTQNALVNALRLRGSDGSAIFSASIDMTAGGNITTNGHIQAGTAGGKLIMNTGTDGVARLTDAATTSFTRLIFGTNDASGAALKKNGANFDVVTGNDSNFSSIRMATTTLTDGTLNITKRTASGTQPGAGSSRLEVVCGTNAGTAKLQMTAGTSSTPVTVVDNVGTGVTGC